MRHPGLISRARHIVAVVASGPASWFGAKYYGRKYFGKRWFG